MCVPCQVSLSHMLVTNNSSVLLYRLIKWFPTNFSGLWIILKGEFKLQDHVRIWWLLFPITKYPHVSSCKFPHFLIWLGRWIGRWIGRWLRRGGWRWLRGGWWWLRGGLTWLGLRHVFNLQISSCMSFVSSEVWSVESRTIWKSVQIWIYLSTKHNKY